MDARSGASNDAALDDERQWLATVLKDLERRSPRVREALKKVLLDGRRDVGPLLGLELTNTENKRENDGQIEDSNLPAPLGPLLGTTFSKFRTTARGLVRPAWSPANLPRGG